MPPKASIRTAGYVPLRITAVCAVSTYEQDEQLRRQAESGDVVAFARLSSRYDEPILGLLLILTSSEQEALELCRATFVSAYRGLARRKAVPWYIWLYRLAVLQWLERANGHPGGSQNSDPLSTRERLVFTLKTNQHLELRTVAQILDASEETVARTFSRAVCKLQVKPGRTVPNEECSPDGRGSGTTDSCAGI